MLTNTNKNKVIIDKDKKVVKPWVFPPLVFESRYRYPLAYVVGGTPHPSGHFSFTSSVNNTVYMEHSDGSIVSADFTGGVNLKNMPAFNRDYGSEATRTFKIWFKIPNKITSFSMGLVTLHGDLPKTLPYYNIRRLLLSAISYFNDFSNSYPPSYLQKLLLTWVTNDTLKEIPEWILKSRIEILVLGDGFNLSNLATSKLERVIEIKDIETFYRMGPLNDVPSNFKDISTLRCINIMSFTEITQNINNCKQITMLLYAYTNNFGDRGSSNFANIGISSWGVGIGGMNLTHFSCHYSLVCPTTLPTGLKECPSITYLGFGNCFQTVGRIDEFINNAYDTITQGASMSVGASPLRNIRLELVINNLGARPSGTYQQPSGYVQGVSNGTPASQMEKIWVIVKQYKWVVFVRSATGGSETLS